MDNELTAIIYCEKICFVCLYTHTFIIYEIFMKKLIEQ